MQLNWVVNESSTSPKLVAGDESKSVIHHCSLECGSEREAQQAVDACVDKACDLLAHNIQDDSRYLLFGWDTEASTLTIAVTDDDKVHDSRDIVQCHFVTGDPQPDPEDIQFWIKDYLTTCAPFLRYSLIAAFHLGSRANCTLL